MGATSIKLTALLALLSSRRCSSGTSARRGLSPQPAGRAAAVAAVLAAVHEPALGEL